MKTPEPADGPTQYGFTFGPAHVERFTRDKSGAVVIGITTPKTTVQVYVTKTGKVRVFSNGEWAAPSPRTAQPSEGDAK